MNGNTNQPEEAKGETQPAQGDWVFSNEETSHPDIYLSHDLGWAIWETLGELGCPDGKRADLAELLAAGVWRRLS